MDILRKEMRFLNMSLYWASCETLSLTYLVYVVDVRSLVRPVVVTLLHSVFRQGRQHDDDDAAALPHHLHIKGQMSGARHRPSGDDSPFISIWSHNGTNVWQTCATRSGILEISITWQPGIRVKLIS